VFDLKGSTHTRRTKTEFKKSTTVLKDLNFLEI